MEHEMRNREDQLRLYAESLRALDCMIAENPDDDPNAVEVCDGEDVLTALNLAHTQNVGGQLCVAMDDVLDLADCIERPTCSVRAAWRWYSPLDDSIPLAYVRDLTCGHSYRGPLPFNYCPMCYAVERDRMRRSDEV